MTSNIWRKTLVYLGLVEEPEEHDEYERSRARSERRNRRTGSGGRAVTADESGLRGDRADRARQSGRSVPGRSVAGTGVDADTGEDDPLLRPLRERRDGGGEQASADGSPEGSNRRAPGGGPAHVRAVGDGRGRVRIIRATTFDDAEDVGQRYRTGQPVLLDLGGVDRETGRRLLDFVSGVIFALRGRILPAGGRAFVLLPEGLGLSDGERRRLADLGYQVRASSADA